MTKLPPRMWGEFGSERPIFGKKGRRFPNRSSTATTPDVAPTITVQPTSEAIANGATVTLTVAAVGTEPLAYQWYSGLAPDRTSPATGTGTTSSVFTSGALSTGTYQFWVEVSNSLDAVASNTATVTVGADPGVAPTITLQPTASDTASVGDARVLSVQATGTGTLTWDWYVGESGDTSTPWTGIQSDGAGISSIRVTFSAAGTYQYWVRVSNSVGSVDSVAAQIVVTATSGTRVLTTGIPHCLGKMMHVEQVPETGEWWALADVTGTTRCAVNGYVWEPRYAGLGSNGSALQPYYDKTCGGSFGANFHFVVTGATNNGGIFTRPTTGNAWTHRGNWGTPVDYGGSANPRHAGPLGAQSGTVGWLAAWQNGASPGRGILRSTTLPTGWAEWWGFGTTGGTNDFIATSVKYLDGVLVATCSTTVPIDGSAPADPANGGIYVNTSPKAGGSPTFTRIDTIGSAGAGTAGKNKPNGTTGLDDWRLAWGVKVGSDHWWAFSAGDQNSQALRGWYLLRAAGGSYSSGNMTWWDITPPDTVLDSTDASYNPQAVVMRVNSAGKLDLAVAGFQSNVGPTTGHGTYSTKNGGASRPYAPAVLRLRNLNISGPTINTGDLTWESITKSANVNNTIYGTSDPWEERWAGKVGSSIEWSRLGGSAWTCQSMWLGAPNVGGELRVLALAGKAGVWRTDDVWATTPVFYPWVHGLPNIKVTSVDIHPTQYHIIGNDVDRGGFGQRDGDGPCCLIFQDSPLNIGSECYSVSVVGPDVYVGSVGKRYMISRPWDRTIGSDGIWRTLASLTSVTISGNVFGSTAINCADDEEHTIDVSTATGGTIFVDEVAKLTGVGSDTDTPALIHNVDNTDKCLVHIPDVGVFRSTSVRAASNPFGSSSTPWWNTGNAIDTRYGGRSALDSDGSTLWFTDGSANGFWSLPSCWSAAGGNPPTGAVKISDASATAAGHPFEGLPTGKRWGSICTDKGDGTLRVVQLDSYSAGRNKLWERAATGGAWTVSACDISEVGEMITSIAAANGRIVFGGDGAAMSKYA